MKPQMNAGIRIFDFRFSIFDLNGPRGGIENRKSKIENVRCASLVAATLLYVSAAHYLCAVETAPPPAAQPPAAEEKKEALPEEAARQRFLAAYQTAQTAEAKAEAVEMLRGLKEQESLRLLAGMLGNSHAVVRRTACAVMATTPDAAGYLVKPLMGTLTDQSPSVRIAASEALANAVVKGQAIKALAYALIELAGSAPARGAAADPRLVAAYDKALRKLTGQKSAGGGARDISSFWMGYWKQHGEEILAQEKQAREEEPPPRPANLPKDIFDK